MPEAHLDGHEVQRLSQVSCAALVGGCLESSAPRSTVVLAPGPQQGIGLRELDALLPPVATS